MPPGCLQAGHPGLSTNEHFVPQFPLLNAGTVSPLLGCGGQPAARRSCKGRVGPRSHTVPLWGPLTKISSQALHREGWAWGRPCPRPHPEMGWCWRWGRKTLDCGHLKAGHSLAPPLPPRLPPTEDPVTARTGAGSARVSPRLTAGSESPSDGGPVQPRAGKQPGAGGRSPGGARQHRSLLPGSLCAVPMTTCFHSDRDVPGVTAM